MRSISRVLGGAALAVSMSFTSLALAGDTATAETLFNKGLDAMKHSQFKEACDAFQGSDEADPSPGTEINLALCNEKQGKIASAWGWYRTAAGLADRRNQKDRADLARAEASKLEPKLHKLTISVKGTPEGLVVTRNGASIPNALLGTDAPIDPGDYSIEVNATGKKAWKQTVHIAAGPGIDRVDVPLLEDAPVAAAGAAGSTTPGGADYHEAQTGKDGSTQRTVGLIVGGVGILAMIGAGGLEIFNLAVTNADYKKIDSDFHTKHCDAVPPGDTTCPALATARQSKDDARHSNQTAAIVMAASGGALIIGGIVLLATAPSSRTTGERTKTRVYPLVGNGTTGLGVSGTF